MGNTEAPNMALPRSPTVDEIPPTCDYQGGPDKQHSLCQTISNAMIQHLTNKGVPINNMVFVKPSVTLWSNAFEYGIGGYSENGLAWRWKIPDVRHGKLTLNLLEFLASAVNIYMIILQLGQGSKILAFTYISSALVWIQKSSFDPVNAESHNAVARWLGWTLVIHKKSLYSQHIKGTEKIIADSLSRDFHKSDQTLTKSFEKSYHNRQRHFSTSNSCPGTLSPRYHR